MKSLLHTITEAESIDDESRQVLLLSQFLHALPDRDLLWIAFLLRGGKVRPLCTRVQVMEWAKRSLAFPAWLVDDSVSESGDLAEALAALFGGKGRSGMSVPELKHVLEEARLLSPEGRRKKIADVWCTLEREQRELFTRLILGGSIASLPARVVHRAVAEHFRVSEEVVALWFLKNRSERGMRMTPFLRWSRAWQPTAYSFAPLDVFPGDAVAGDMNYWRVDRVAGHERVQLIKRNGEVYLWTQHRSCLYVDAALAAGLPDGTVLECGHTHGGPLCAYALLEYQGADVRSMTSGEQSSIMERLCAPLAHHALKVSQRIDCNAGSDLTRSHAVMKGTQDWLLLRPPEGAPGRWMRWDAEPHSVDCVLLSVRRDDTAICGEMSLGVWDEDSLVPCARVRPDLPVDELQRIAEAVADATIERFGPVNGVHPSLVFTLEFDAVDRSARHKSGLRLRNPRVREWREDAAPDQAGTLMDLKSMMVPESGSIARSDTVALSLFPAP